MEKRISGQKNKLTLAVMLMLTFTLAICIAGGWQSIQTAYATEGFISGAGTELNPYIITTAEQLDMVRNDLSAHYKLGNDINLSDFLDDDDDTYGEDGWLPIGDNQLSPFIGTFDGNNFKITGIWINRSSTNYVGLFGYINGATIKNLGIIGGSNEIRTVTGINGNSYVGSVAGYVYNCIIQNCYNAANISGNSAVGGIAGFICNNIALQDCYNRGNINGSSSIGGIAGFIYNNTTLQNCYNTGSILGNNEIGGIVGKINESTVQNCYNTGKISGLHFAGGVAGYIDINSTVQNCYNMGELSGINYIGGIAGKIDESSIQSCYNTGMVIGSDSVSGIAGSINKSTIQNCYSTSNVSGINFVGGVAGDIENSTVKNCYYNTDNTIALSAIGQNANSTLTNTRGLTTTEMTGDNAVYNMTGLYSEDFWVTTPDFDSCCGIINYYLQLKIFVNSDVKTAAISLDSVSISNVLPLNHSHFTKGNGTALNPYVVSTAKQLNHVRNHLSEHFILSNDIDLSDFLNSGTYGQDGWLPIGDDYNRFKGTFDGNNHEILGLWINRNNTYVGLFGYLNGEPTMAGTIKNLGVNGGSNATGTITGINGNYYVGGIAGIIDSYSTIQYCYNIGIVSGRYYVGGIVGRVEYNSTVQNCYNTGDIDGRYYVGGVVGQGEYNSTVQNCYNTGDIDGNYYVGGIVGQGEYNSTVQNCYNTGDIDGRYYVGGIVGRVEYNSTVQNCYNTGDIDGRYYVGGVVGYISNSTIQNCYNTGNVWDGQFVGGIAGAVYSFSAIESCYNTGNVNGNDRIGGVAAYIEFHSVIRNCFNMGDISSNKFVGGITAWIQYKSTIQNCYNMGNVSGTGNYVGGIVGSIYSNSTIKSCYNTGIISGNSSVGGFAGLGYDSKIESCYNTGTVNGNSSVGGFAGSIYSGFIIENCYAIGTVGGTDQYVGGIAGHISKNSTLQNCYYNSDIAIGLDAIGQSSDSTVNNTEGLTTLEMITEEFLSALGDEFMRRDTTDEHCYYPELMSIFYSSSLQNTHSKASAALTRRDVTITATGIEYGDTLQSSVLTVRESGTTIIATGTVIWADSSAMPNVLNSGYAAIFTPENDLYKPSSQNIFVEVSPKVISIVWDGFEGLTYDGQDKTVTATATGLIGTDNVTVTVIGGTQKNAGSYTATATALSNSNYKLPTDNLTKDYIIAKAAYSGTAATAEIERVTKDSITIKLIEGAEYSINGGKSWHDANDFNNLKSATIFEIAVRIKETANTLASTASVNLEVKTKGLSGGAIVAITGSIVALVAAGFTTLWFVLKKRKSTI